MAARVLGYVTGMVNKQLLLQNDIWLPNVEFGAPICPPAFPCRWAAFHSSCHEQTLGRRCGKDMQPCIARCYFRRLVEMIGLDVYVAVCDSCWSFGVRERTLRFRQLRSTLAVLRMGTSQGRSNSTQKYLKF